MRKWKPQYEAPQLNEALSEIAELRKKSSKEYEIAI